MTIHLTSIVISVLLATGCGHVAKQIDEFQRVGADQVAVGGLDDSRDKSAVTVSAEAEPNYVADMECPPIETAGANLRLLSSCSHGRNGGIAITDRDGRSTGRNGSAHTSDSPALASAAAARPTDRLGRQPDSLDEEMEVVPMPPRVPKRERMGHRKAVEDDVAGSPMPTLMPVPSLSPKMSSHMLDADEMCEGHWIRWGAEDEFYDCCLAAPEWPSELIQMCSSTHVFALDD